MAKRQNKLPHNEPTNDIKKKLEEVVQKVEPLEDEIKSVQMQVATSSLWSGPMPPPDVIEGYEKSYPGAAKLLFEQFVKQSNHRMEIETKVVESNIRNESRGQWMGFVLLGLIVVLGMTGVFLDKQVAGTITAIGGLTGILTLFLARKGRSRQELEQKRRPQLPNPNQEG